MRPGTNSSGEASRYLWTPWTRAEAQLPTPTMATRTAGFPEEGLIPSGYHGKRLPESVYQRFITSALALLAARSGALAAELGRQHPSCFQQPFEHSRALHI